MEDRAGDVLAGIDFLKARKDIDPRRIGLIGHSEGAEIAPYAASRSSNVAFVVMLAGPGVPGDELLRKQAELVIRAQGGGDEAVAQNRTVQDALLEITKQEKDPTAAAEKIRAAFKRLAPQAPQSMIDGEATRDTSAEFRSIVTYDPAPALQKLKMPVLALNGSRDVQVAPAQNLPAISAALKTAGNPDVTATELPGLNHLFQTCKVCTVAEYGTLEETFAPSALKLIGDWILEHTATPTVPQVH
jgi:pimeloyl-ACP methyl ester carboxylesterase